MDTKESKGTKPWRGELFQGEQQREDVPYLSSVAKIWG